MDIPPEPRALVEVESLLARLLEQPPSRPPRVTSPGPADAVVELGPYVFAVEWRRSGAAAAVSMAVELARRRADVLGRGAIPLVAVPFMGEVGRDRCTKAGVAWIDLSGNAQISAPGLRVWVEGRLNQYKRIGRPSSAFAPKSARIARWLLMHPGQKFTQRGLAQATRMSEGFTSRIVARLERDELIARAPDGSIWAPSPDLLLDAWREDYHFSKHQVVHSHLPARSGDSAIRILAEKLDEQGVTYAATGLAAAWLLTRFAGFRIASVYLREPPTEELMERLGVRHEPRGSNLWLASPNDEGVFHGSTDRDGVHCVHPVQAYLDLADHPERAPEAADHLRSELLTWGGD